jgi:ubiquinone/menaquinone biosynthesis C-methylase UbiE
MGLRRDIVSTSTYDEIAEWYDEWVGSDAMRADPFFPAVEALMGEVAGRRVCDLACGQGRVARYLADLGASVTGVDLSERLLDIARRREAEEPRGIEYLHGDARNLAGVAGDSFEIVVCHMALMDIADLDPMLRSVARIVRPDGCFVFSIIHPCYNPPRSGEMAAEDGMVRTVGGYWEEGYWRSEARTGPPGKVGSYHRTLSTYVNALTDAGLMVERMSEPRATGELAARRTVWVEVPAMLAVECRKAPSR